MLIVLAASITGVVLFDVILETLLKNKLSSLIRMEEDRIYDYQYDDIEISFLKGHLSLTNLKITPRQKVIDSLKSEGIIKKNIFLISLDEFVIHGLESWNFLFHGEVRIGYIDFNRPEVILYINKKVPPSRGKDLTRDIIVPTLKYAHLDSFTLSRARFEIMFVEDDTISAAYFDSSSVAIYSVLTDSTLLASDIGLNFDHIALDINNLRLTAMKDHTLEVSRVFNNYKKREFYLSNVKFIPRAGKFEFAQQQPEEKDWIMASVRDITLSGLDMPRYLDEGVIAASSLLIDGLDLEIYRDKRMPDQAVRIKYLPSHVLRRMNLPLDLDCIQISNGVIKYLQWNENAKEPMTVEFNETSVEISRFTTVREILNIEDSLQVKIATSFMKTGKLQLQYYFRQLDTTDYFSLYGVLTGLELPSLNPLLEHVAFVKFEEGRLNKLEFEITADDDFSSGWLDIDFEDVKKVTFIRNTEEMKELKSSRKNKRTSKKSLSFLANTFIPNEYNPTKSNYKTGIIQTERNKNKSVFNYLIKSLESGIKSSLLPGKVDSGGKKGNGKGKKAKTKK